jgi:alkaline phosphatase
MVESGRIDHANHDANAHRMVTDGEAFAKAVQAAMNMTNPEETLIIVTADHEHAIAFSGYAGRGSNILGLSYEINPNGTKHLDKLNLADDGKPYTTLGYLNGASSVLKKQADGSYFGTRAKLTQKEVLDPDYVQESLIPRSSETHSGEDVAVYARGPWAHLFDGTIEQNFIFNVMNYAINNEK